MEIIRRTKSACPVCLETVDADLVFKGGQVWMVKACVKHGSVEILLSGDGASYKKLDAFYFAVMKGKKKVLEYEIWPTYRCNMSCPICSMGDLKQDKVDGAPSCADIVKAAQESRAAFFTLSGGEPTCRPDLSEIIRALVQQRKTVTINTNGLKCVNRDYIKGLVCAGLARVNLQFDGFRREAYLALRGADFLDAKLKVLSNLKALDVSVVLNVTVAKGLNEAAVTEVIDYAAKHDFINGVTFFTVCNLGGARAWPLDQYIVPDEIVTILERQTQGKISAKSLFLFQKLHLTLKSFLSQKACLYNRVYVLVRNGDGYRPIGEFVDLERLEPVLDLYRALYSRNQLLAKALLSLCLPAFLLFSVSPLILKELLTMAFSYFFKTGGYLNGRKFLYVSASTACDPFKVDYSMMVNCQNEIMCVDEMSGEFRHQGSICRYGMKLEKFWHE